MKNLQILVVALMLLGMCPAASAAEFAEDFESYASGSDLHGQNGWKGWDDVASVGSPTSSDHAFSGTNSVEIIGAADLVHVFDVAGGRWEFTAMQYIPSGTTGTSFFILMNTYSHGGTKDWSVQTEFHLDTGAINYWHGGSGQIIYDQWIELKYLIDLDNNTVDKYYNGEYMVSDTWDDGNHGTLQAIDLYGNGASSIYYDDIVIEAPLGAYKPEPADGAIHAATWVTLKWQPGGGAVSHDVYLSDNYDDVSDGAAEAFRGNQTAVSLVAGFPGFAYPDGLVPGTTYYWRIAEIGADGAVTHAGEIWSFMVPPRTAFRAVPADGAKFVGTDGTLSWTGGFDAKLHTVHFGDNFDDVNNAPAGIPQALTTYDPGLLAQGTVYYWRVDEFDGFETHKGDVWSFTTLPVVPLHSDPDLVAWWTFDEGQGTTAVDWSGHDNHVTLFESKWAPAAVGDTGLNIGDYGAIRNLSYAADDLTEVTVATWIRTSSSSDQYIVSFDRNEYYRLEINGSGGGPGQVGWDVMTSSGQIDYGSVRRVDDGRWHHVAGVYDNGTLTIYIDGAPEPSAAGGPTYGSGNTRYGFIGANSEAGGYNSPTPSGNPLAGEVDDIRIYHRALTQEEIATVMRGDPKLAGDPNPARDAEVDIRDIDSLTWSKGDTAVSHDVYFGTDKDAMEFLGNQAGTSLSLADLVEFGGWDYYWRIDEVEADGTVNAGTTWKFTVPNYLIVDSFDSYNDLEEDQPGSNRIFNTWIDGYGTTTNGSQAGNLDPPFMSAGQFGQAMPLSYNNAGKTSEATKTLTAKKDWTVEGVRRLWISFSGASTNAADRIYVALDNAVIYHPDDAATQDGGWNEWMIDLQEFADQGVDLTNVGSITLGIGTRGAPVATGGTGTVHFDYIILIR